jgi:hypothetical protein
MFVDVMWGASDVGPGLMPRTHGSRLAGGGDLGDMQEWPTMRMTATLCDTARARGGHGECVERDAGDDIATAIRIGRQTAG